jgi:uncharacterized iron-regulated protein
MASSLFHFIRSWVLSLLVMSVVSSAHASGWDQKIISAKDGREMSLNELGSSLVFARNVILGEKHNTSAIQLAQSKVMGTVIDLSPGEHFATFWEFLNYADQAAIDSSFFRYLRSEVTVEELLTQIQGSSKYNSYAPLLEVTKRNQGSLMGVNLSRADKEPVVQGGLMNAKPNTIPSGFEMGGAYYFERFKITMQGHTTESQLLNYYAAQCLTDDVLAEQMLKLTHVDRRFLIVGSFHSDYFDGVVARLKRRAPDQSVAVVRFVDASDYSEVELQALVVDPKYGPIADAIYFVNEPIR